VIEVLLGGGLGAAIFAAGLLTGRVWRRQVAPAIPAEPKPICGCKHHFSRHDDAEGKCHATVEEATLWQSNGNPYRWKRVPCTCQRYTGPEPLPTYVAGEIA
jgi:hypothetical protein